jgi:hypothetical protein
MDAVNVDRTHCKYGRNELLILNPSSLLALVAPLDGVLLAVGACDQERCALFRGDLSCQPRDVQVQLQTRTVAYLINRHRRHVSLVCLPRLRFRKRQTKDDFEEFPHNLALGVPDWTDCEWSIAEAGQLLD